jgi:hypothetical protein
MRTPIQSIIFCALLPHGNVDDGVPDMIPVVLLCVNPVGSVIVLQILKLSAVHAILLGVNVTDRTLVVHAILNPRYEAVPKWTVESPDVVVPLLSVTAT